MKWHCSKDKTDWYFVMVLVTMGSLGFIHQWAAKVNNGKMDVLNYKIESLESRIDSLQDYHLPLPKRKSDQEEMEMKHRSELLLPPKPEERKKTSFKLPKIKKDYLISICEEKLLKSSPNLYSVYYERKWDIINFIDDLR